MAKVLLVEDDNNLREIYQARLAAEGYDIVAAQNGEEALVVAKQNKPDLIISDVMMPRISGFEMLDILRNTDELKNTKVIMLTALGQAEDQARADNLGADKYLVKSQVTLEDIVNAAKSLLGEDEAAGAVSPAPAADSEGSSDTPAAASTDDPSQTATPSDTASSTPPEPAPEPETAPPTAVETPVAVPTPAADTPVPPAIESTDTAVPASIVPQPDTTVVVPPAPANPTPPSVTVTPLPSDSIDQSASSTPPEPAPEPETAPPTAVETPVAVPTPADAANPAAAVQASQALKTEEAAVQAQIDTFATDDEASQPAIEPTPDNITNDAAIANAVEELNGTIEAAPPAELTPTAPIAPEEPVAGDANQPTVQEPVPPAITSVGGTKIIQPLNDVPTTGVNLDELLAKEEAKEAADKPISEPPVPPAAPGAGVDPNSIAL